MKKKCNELQIYRGGYVEYQRQGIIPLDHPLAMEYVNVPEENIYNNSGIGIRPLYPAGFGLFEPSIEPEKVVKTEKISIKPLLIPML